MIPLICHYFNIHWFCLELNGGLISLCSLRLSVIGQAGLGRDSLVQEFEVWEGSKPLPKKRNAAPGNSRVVLFKSCTFLAGLLTLAYQVLFRAAFLRDFWRAERG